MCKRPEDTPADPERMQELQRLKGLARALHCPTRWDIIDIIGSGTATTDTIRKKMSDKGYDFTRSGLYYHLSELSDAGIIEVASYVEGGQGAPTKEWTLRKQTIEIDLVNEEA
ncbi:MAG: helix-turn-helix domain-containing protein [archaeon]